MANDRGSAIVSALAKNQIWRRMCCVTREGCAVLASSRAVCTKYDSAFAATKSAALADAICRSRLLSSDRFCAGNSDCPLWEAGCGQQAELQQGIEPAT